MLNDLFDEKSERWIKYYKIYVKVMFWLYMVAAAVLCILGWTDCIIMTYSAFLDGLILLVASALVGVIHLIVNMLIIQFLNNVQIIRNNIEKKLGADAPVAEE